MKNYYEILEVNEHASKEIIEKAYNVLIRKYDASLYLGQERKEIEAKTKDIDEAYKVLSNEFLRSQYDVELQKIKIEKNVKQQKIIKENNIINKEKNVKDSRKEDRNINIPDESEISNKPKRFGRFKMSNEVGSLGATLGLVKDVFKMRPKKIEFDKITKTDIKAFILTIIVLIILGIILWFIPFTNGWMRQLLFENPLFSWIWKIF